jgi:hypothetical protein
MGTKLNLKQINEQMDLEKIKKDNPRLYAELKEKQKIIASNKVVKK